MILSGPGLPARERMAIGRVLVNLTQAAASTTTTVPAPAKQQHKGPALTRLDNTDPEPACGVPLGGSLWWHGLQGDHEDCADNDRDGARGTDP